MNGPFRALLAGRPTHRLAVDGDHFRRKARDGRHPGDKAVLELIAIQCGEDIAEMIMRRRALLERAEPAKQSELLGFKQRNLDEALRSGSYGLGLTRLGGHPEAFVRGVLLCPRPVHPTRLSFGAR